MSANELPRRLFGGPRAITLPILPYPDPSSFPEEVQRILDSAVRRQKKLFGLPRPAHLWLSMGYIPEYLELNYKRLRAVMLQADLPADLREAVACGVSIANVCHY